MAVGVNPYRIRVIGELDSTRIKAELENLAKNNPLIVGGSKGGKGGAFSEIEKSAKRAGKGIKGFNGQVVQTTKSLNGVKKGSVNGKVYRTIGVEAQQSAKHMKSLGSETLNVAKKVAQFGAVTAVIRAATSGLADMVHQVFELDTALTEFKKVSNLTGKELEQYTTQAYKAGRETAKTGTEMIEAATQFRKMGYSDQQSMQLATTATMFQNIADAEISAGDAALFINSQLKAFNFTADQSMHVIDSVNEVANNFAVGTNDLQLALSKTASAMGGFGNSFEQTIGIITAGTEIMVGQPSKVARGWRTIGANITKLAKTTDVYRDASGKVEIQMRKNDGTMKNTYEFLNDLHDSWGSLNKEQQTAIALEMGGKNQMEVFMATMNNFTTAIKATTTAEDAEGSAAKENAKYIQSLQGSLQDLKSAWSELAYTLIKSDMLKKGIDTLTKLLHFLSSEMGQALIKGALFVTTINLSAKALSGLGGIIKGINLVRIVTGLGRVTKGLEGTTKAAKGARYISKVLKLQFGDLLALLMSPLGLVAGVSLLTVGLAKYVDIGKSGKANKIDKQVKKTQDEIDALNDKLKDNRKEWKKLREKQLEGDLTEAEEARLRQLEAETQELKRQYDLKMMLLGQQVKEKWTTGAGSQLKGAAKEQYTNLRGSGRSEESAMATLGLSKDANRLDVVLVNYKIAAEEATRAENDYRAAMEKTNAAKKEYGKNSEEYLKAAERETKAYDKYDAATEESSKRLKALTKQRDKMYEDFGSKELFDKNAPETLKKSRDQLDKIIKASKNIDDLKNGVGDVTKTFKSLNKASKQSGNDFLKLSKDGKKIEHINVRKLQQSMADVGVDARETLEYLKEFAKSNPEAQIKLNGEDVVIDDLEVINNQIQKVDKEEAKPTIDANTKGADEKIKNVEENIDKLSGKNASVSVGAKTTKNKGLASFQDTINKLKGKSISVKAKTSGKKKVDDLQASIKKLPKNKEIHITTYKKTVQEAHGVRHFAAGKSLANAEVNEYGFEIIHDADTGFMRVVNGGKRGYTYIGKGDSVFTHNQSVRMLRDAGTTEGEAIYGHGNEDFVLSGIRKPKGYAQGLTKKQYNKKYKAITSAFDKDLATLEYKRDYYHWTNAEFAAEYSKLYDKYNNKLTALNKKKVKKGVSKKTTLGTERKRAYKLAQSDVESEAFKEGIESTLKDIIGDATGLEEMLKAIEEADKAQRITAEETADYIKEAYKTNTEYNLKQFKNNKETYANMRKLIEDYYQDGKISGEDYYDYLEQLAEEQLDKEKERLSERVDKIESTYDLAKAYVERQISLLETENEEQEKQNELVELQNNLAKARNQRVRIYKEGEGFVYEQDTEAIREATQALQEYQSNASSAENATNPVLAQWQAVLDLFDDLEADYELKVLENKVGSTVGALFGGLGTSTNAWSDWIKNNLSTSYGLQDVINQMDELVDTNDILNYLDNNGQVTDAIIDAAIGNNILPSTYAAAITQAAQGINAITNTGASIATQSTIAGLTNGAVIMSGGTQYGNVYNFDNLVLPNVTNANEFVSALDNLSTTALQVSTQRS